ncbi:hypothetical protein AP1H75_12440 [Apilactobacillus apinorum]|uniref:oligosaccharide flippase family protein n=1 Tax=Apilactobacillus apinorum TaxID=1218495 RepID=UPI0030EA89D3
MDKKMVRNIINLVISNFMSLAISIFSSFITPIILGKSGYGYYKIFTLYTTYVPLLHIGFIDGVFIRNAGKRISDFSVKKFRAYTKFIFLFEGLLSLLLVIISLILFDNMYKEIFISVAIFSFLMNFVTYFQFISKCGMKFDELAMISRMQSLIVVFFLSLSFIMYKFLSYDVSVTYYLFYINFSMFVALIYYLFKYRFIVFGKRRTIFSEKKNIILFFKLGFTVMISYQITMIMINADNQFISMFFSVKEYGNYAFSYSLASLLITLFAAISSVTLPYMKKMGKESVLRNHSDNISYLLIIIFVILLSYYPISIIIINYIPGYEHSLAYLRYIFPGVGITCIVQSYLFNDFIMFKRIKKFCYISFLNVLLDFGIYYILFMISKNSFIIAFSSVLLLMIWYLSLEIYMKNQMPTKYLKNFCYLFILSISFIFINNAFSLFIGLIIYLLVLIIFTVLFYFRLIINIGDIVTK